MRTSFSTIVNESYDLTCVVLDAEANSIAQGTFSVPVFIGSAPITLRHMLKRYPAETLKPGDVIITNDPWLGTGHLYDITMVRPVFRKGRIVAYTLSITHLPDIGGSGFGSSAVEVYHEGLRIPICKLYEEGRLNELLLEIIRTNVRVPEQVIGDVMANVACNEVGGRELLAFMDEYGLDDLTDLSRAIRGQSEAAMRAKIRELGQGTYHNRIQVEGFDGPCDYVVRIDVKGDSVAYDFTGTSGCVRAAVNVPFCYTNAMALHAIKSLLLPNIPNNAGSIAPISVFAPPGCILNAQPPFATGGRHAMGHFVTPLVYGALAQALPDRVQAGSGMMNLITFQGTRRDERPFSTLYFAAGGYGALDGLDGWCTLPHPSNMAVVPVEVWETLTHTTIESKRLLPEFGRPRPLARRSRAGGRPAQRHRPPRRHARHGQPHHVSGARHVRRRRRDAQGACHRRQAGARQGPQRAGAGPAHAHRRGGRRRLRRSQAACARARSPRTWRRATSAPRPRERSTAGKAEEALGAVGAMRWPIGQRSSNRAAQPRIEHVPDAVAEQVEGEHGDGDGEPGKQHQPPRRHEAGVQSVRQHVAPGGRRRRDADAEEAERGLDDDGDAQMRGRQDQEGGDALRQDVPEHQAHVARRRGRAPPRRTASP